MIIGYSRIALFQSQLEAEEQVELLLNYGCLEEHIYQEQTAAQDLRGQLRLALNALRKGDKLVLCKLSALGSSLGQLSAAFLEIDRKSADLVILDIGGLRMDSGQKTGQAMFKSLRELADLPHEVHREKKFEAVKVQRDVL